MNNKITRVLIAVIIPLVLLVVACGKAEPTSTPTPPSGSGTLEVRVTDAIDPEVSKVFVQVSEVTVHREGTGEWETVVVGPETFDLMALTGVEGVLGESSLPVGRYTQVRLNVLDVQIERDGELLEAEVPSGVLKLVGTFKLEEEVSTIITIDFDVEKSLVARGNGSYLFKPVVKLITREPGIPGEETAPLTDLPTPIVTPVPTATATPSPTPTPVETVAPSSTVTPAPTPTQDPTEVFFLAMESPEETESFVTDDSIEVVGRTRIDAVVSVNDTVVEVDTEGRFSHTVQLEEGPNVIEVVSSIATGDELDQVIVVIYTPGN